MIDGDNQGVAKRKLALDDALRAANESPRGHDEPVVIFVPTWSVETWLLFPAENASESVSYRDQLREPERSRFDQAVGRLVKPGLAELPSLLDASGELSRAPA